MGKKRLIVEMDEVEHAALAQSARGAGMTLSNYIRNALGLPLLQQGIKRPDAPQQKGPDRTSRRNGVLPPGGRKGPRRSS